MAWIYLLFASLFELGWVLGIRSTDGFTRLWPSVLVAGSMLASCYLLALAVRQIPVGVAYALWTGVGVLAAFAASLLLHGESLSPARTLCAVLLLASILGLKLLR
jgi:quaternary ammonium compound-resistance protein SugE